MRLKNKKMADTGHTAPCFEDCLEAEDECDELQISGLKTAPNRTVSFAQRQRATDEEQNSSQSLFMKLSAYTSGCTFFFFANLTAIVGWSCVCAWAAGVLQEQAEHQPGGTADRWLEWIESSVTTIKVVGSLFTFSLVFRFNQCYSRWWVGRELWGQIIYQTLDFSEKVSLWIIDHEYADRLNRLITVFPYACKAQLRGKSLHDPTESGDELVQKGLLTLEELTYLGEHPCWQPHFFLDLIRTIIAKVFLAEYERGKVLVLPKSNKIHEKLFAPLEKPINELARTIGDAICVHAAGMPQSYDAVHHFFFWTYFGLAPITWATTMGWVTPILTGVSSSIIMILITMGTSLVDPFGTDIVDLPLERFCETIEVQIEAIQNRSKCKDMMKFAEFSKTKRNLCASKTQLMGSKRCSYRIDF